MAHLEVQPKKSRPWWLWLILLLIALAIIFALLKGCGHNNNSLAMNDTVANDSLHNGDAIAATEPDWKTVDFNSPASSDPDIMDKDISISGNDKYTIYTLGENILFSTDNNTFQAGGEDKLKQIASSFKKRFKDSYIGVYGSTDSTGTKGHNKELGAERALVVKDWLIKNGGIAENKLYIHSFGETDPLATNATKAGRQQNRNVQIVVFKGSVKD